MPEANERITLSAEPIARISGAGGSEPFDGASFDGDARNAPGDEFDKLLFSEQSVHRGNGMAVHANLLRQSSRARERIPASEKTCLYRAADTLSESLMKSARPLLATRRF